MEYSTLPFSLYYLNTIQYFINLLYIYLIIYLFDYRRGGILYTAFFIVLSEYDTILYKSIIYLFDYISI
jgi:hypothetical protein